MNVLPRPRTITALLLVGTVGACVTHVHQAAPEGSSDAGEASTSSATAEAGADGGTSGGTSGGGEAPTVSSSDGAGVSTAAGDTGPESESESESDAGSGSSGEPQGPPGFTLVHHSEVGPFPDHDRIDTGEFHGRDALIITHEVESPESILNYNDLGDGPRGGLEGGGKRAGLFRFKMYCEPNACWTGDGSGKLIGIYGGNSAGGAVVAGIPDDEGCPTPMQLGPEGGWSSRLTFNYTDGNPSMYSYEQNRCAFNAGVADGSVYGKTRTLLPTFTFPEEVWTQVEIEVVMNDPGEANGTGRIEVDGIAIATGEGIMWQSDALAYGVNGVFVSYMSQSGHTVTPGNSIGLSDFEFYVQEW